MKKTLEIMRYEIVSALKRPSFLFFTFGVPLIAVIAFAGYSIISANRGSSGDVEQGPEESQLETEGYVDLSGLITMIPSDLPANTLVAYSNEADAQMALDAQEISAYYIVTGDYVEQRV